MKPTNYISLALATLVMAFSVGCKKTDKPNTFLPSIKGGGTTGNGNESETGQGGKIGQEGGITSTDGGEVGLTGLEDFENMLMDREAFAAQTVYFGFDRSEIEPGDTDNVNAVAEALSSSPQNKVLIEGHCDERGTEEYNTSLGERRALAVLDELVRVGVSVDRMRPESYGEKMPLVETDTKESHAMNRRGEFVRVVPRLPTAPAVTPTGTPPAERIDFAPGQ